MPHDRLQSTDFDQAQLLFLPDLYQFKGPDFKFVKMFLLLIIYKKNCKILLFFSINIIINIQKKINRNGKYNSWSSCDYELKLFNLNITTQNNEKWKRAIIYFYSINHLSNFPPFLFVPLYK